MLLQAAAKQHIRFHILHVAFVCAEHDDRWPLAVRGALSCKSHHDVTVQGCRQASDSDARHL